MPAREPPYHLLGMADLAPGPGVHSSDPLEIDRDPIDSRRLDGEEPGRDLLVVRG